MKFDLRYEHLEIQSSLRHSRYSDDIRSSLKDVLGRLGCRRIGSLDVTFIIYKHSRSHRTVRTAWTSDLIEHCRA